MKLAYFKGDSCSNEILSQSEVMAMVESGKLSDWDTPTIEILLVPDDYNLEKLNGEGWTERPASVNSGHCLVPRGSKMISLKLGEKWPSKI